MERNKIVIAHNLGYRCSIYGHLINPNGDEIGFTGDDGYTQTRIRIDGKTVKINAHRLQAYQKFGDKVFEKGIVVRHLDGDKTNFSYKNIEIGTQSDNMMDRSKEDRLAHSLKATAKVRKYDKLEVREFHKTSKSYKKTMEHFGISSKGTLSHILNK